VVTSLAVVALAVGLPLTPLAPALGFVAPPPVYYAAVALMVVLYLLAVQGVKGWFYRRFGDGAPSA
jgi:Mg2+-importing ATPase